MDVEKKNNEPLSMQQKLLMLGFVNSFLLDPGPALSKDDFFNARQLQVMGKSINATSLKMMKLPIIPDRHVMEEGEKLGQKTVEANNKATKNGLSHVRSRQNDL